MTQESFSRKFAEESRCETRSQQVDSWTIELAKVQVRLVLPEKAAILMYKQLLAPQLRPPNGQTTACPRQEPRSNYSSPNVAFNEAA
jgi:hypothetical protein